LYKETGLDKIRTIAGCRAVNFEKKARKENKRRLIIECINEKEREERNGIKREGREGFYRQNGFSSEDIKLLRKKNIEIAGIVRKNKKEKVG